MYKRKTSGYADIIKLVIVTGFFTMFLTNTSFALVNIGALLETAVEKHEMDGTLKKLPGKAGVGSLFKRSLQYVKGRDVQVVDTSANQVLSYIQQKPLCNTINKNDIINILYYTANYGNFGVDNIGNYARDISFRRLIDQTIVQDANSKVPTVSERNTSCIKLSQCREGKTWSIAGLSQQTQIRCENTVRDLYTSEMLTNRSVSLLTEGTFGENIFQNGSLQDSDYDLMIDIYNIGRLMFQWYTAPVELVYYQFPTAGQGGGGWGSLDPSQPGSYIPPSAVVAQVPVTSPWWAQSSYTPGMFTVWWVSVPELPINTSQDSWSWPWSNPLTPDPVDEAFIENTNTSPLSPIPVATSPDVVIWSNMCIVLTDDPIAAADVTIDTVSFEEYTETLEDYYQTLQENIIIDNLLADSEISIKPSLANDPTETDPVVVNNYQAEKEALEQEVVEMISSVFDVTKDPEDATIKSCVADCQWLPPVDWAVCTAKCLCGETGSPAQSINGFEIIQPDAFKIRFCQVPASSTPIKKWRTIYSIEEIFQEMRTIFVSLRDSGELFKHVRTKEFLDSSIKKNKFGSMFAFNIKFSIKGTQDNTPANQYKEELSLANEKLESTLLNQSKSMSPLPERNKYVMIANPAAIIASQATDGSVADYQRRIEEIQKDLNDSLLTMDKNLTKLTMLQKSLIVNDAVHEFFIANFNFWDSVIQSFAEFNGIAESMKTKAQKAK
jgi:hypothetical protein